MAASFSYYWFRFRSAWRWYAGAGTYRDVADNRLAEFIREVYRDDRHYHAFDLIQAIRRYWSRREGVVKLQSLGAPSKTTTRTERSVRSLVKSNAIGDDCGRLLFRLALWLKADRILEFGTNAGISTLYLHAADTRALLQTVEGNPAVAALARETFAKAGASNQLKPYVSRFDAWLAEYWPADPPEQPLDLFFLDGDHREGPTLDYVRRLLPAATAQSVFVIADIHWSEGMERAWSQLKDFPEVRASLDVYHFGLLFFDPEMKAEHVSLVDAWWKPWRF
ncbi:MAG: class I SAM-dependent methyltransferase [Bacteroidota bacterium]